MSKVFQRIFFGGGMTICTICYLAPTLLSPRLRRPVLLSPHLRRPALLSPHPRRPALLSLISGDRRCCPSSQATGVAVPSSQVTGVVPHLRRPALLSPHLRRPALLSPHPRRPALLSPQPRAFPPSPHDNTRAHVHAVKSVKHFQTLYLIHDFSKDYPEVM